MDRITQQMMFGAASSIDIVGQAEYITPGTFTFIVPDSLYLLCLLVVESGQGGGDSNGGKGGNLRYRNDVPVTPGESLTINVFDGGASSFSSPSGSLGQHTTVMRGAVTILSSATALGSGVGGGDGGAGGVGQSKTGTYGAVRNGGGGGGSGGYAGNGGTGASNDEQPTAGSGGGGGGGGQDTSPAQNNGSLELSFGSPGRNGGGVGLKGQGSNGAAGNSLLTPTSGGSGSDPGGLINIGRGGAAGYTQTGAGDDVAGERGGTGGARIIHGFGRAYPSTRTADE